MGIEALKMLDCVNLAQSRVYKYMVMLRQPMERCVDSFLKFINTTFDYMDDNGHVYVRDRMEEHGDILYHGM